MVQDGLIYRQSEVAISAVTETKKYPPTGAPPLPPLLFPPSPLRFSPLSPTLTPCHVPAPPPFPYPPTTSWFATYLLASSVHLANAPKPSTTLSPTPHCRLPAPDSTHCKRLPYPRTHELHSAPHYLYTLPQCPQHPPPALHHQLHRLKYYGHAPPTESIAENVRKLG